MPSVEQSERIGGAAFLSIPALDSFVWALDNYARIELLVRLHDQLPPILTSPLTSFVCTCIGLTFLYLSNVRQLRRVSETASARRLVDTSGTEYRSTEKPRWILPVCISFALALIATPILAITYSLAYKGTAPRGPVAPAPPYFAYARTERSKKSVQKPLPNKALTAIAPHGIANAAPNFGEQTVNNYAPPERHIPPDIRNQLIQILSGATGTADVEAIAGDTEAYEYASEWNALLNDARWTIKNPIVPMAFISKKGVELWFRGEYLTPGQNLSVEQLPPQAKAVAQCLSGLHITFQVGRGPGVIENGVNLIVGSNSAAANH